MPAINAEKTHCKYGHPFTAKSYKTVNGKTRRTCRTCEALAARDYYTYKIKPARDRKRWAERLRKLKVEVARLEKMLYGNFNGGEANG